jgi:hypothetical protein
VTYPAAGPTPTGDVTFNVYGPADDTCAGTPVFTSAGRALTGSTAGERTATSATFTPVVPGTYHVVATYNGGSDANYTSVSGVCSDQAEQVVVAEATPAIATVVSNSTRTVGQSVTDTATVTYPAAGPTPTGDVTFNVYGPADDTCTGAPVFTSAGRSLTGSTAGTRTATSGTFVPQAVGTYHVVATYNGGSDPNYTSVSGACSDQAEQVVVSEATPNIATVVSNPTRAVGQSFTDTATVTYPVNAPTPTGTVTMRQR